MMGDRYTSVSECRYIRELHDDGVPLTDIAAEIGRTERTVNRHCNGGCFHDYQNVSSTIGEITESVADLADTLQRIPSLEDYKQWADAPCGGKSARNIVGDGDWSVVLQKAGLPVIASGSPRRIREIAYEHPHLTTGYESEGES